MRRLAFALAALLSSTTTVRAEPTPAVTMQSQIWQVTPVTNAGNFVFCSASISFNPAGGPVTLTIGFDRAEDWAASVYSNSFTLPSGAIKGQLWFDDQAPTDINGAVRVPTTVSFLLRGPSLLQANAKAKKLTLSF